MNSPPLTRTLGQKAARQIIAAAWESKRFPHALLVHGAPGLGQAALVLDTAQLILCESRQERPCGRCGSCIGFRAQSLENLHHLLPLVKGGKGGKTESDGEGLDAAAMDEFVERQQALHRDPYLFSWPERAGIAIHQVRELQKQLLYAESRGRARVVILPWLEALRPEAANALLKTLEEPPKDTYFLITSEDRAGILPTLLSRCMQVALTPMNEGEFRQALQDWKARLPGGPKPALVPLAEGAPGLYLALHESGEAGLEATARFLAAALELDLGAFLEHIETSETFADMEGATQVLEMTLKLIRLEQKRRVMPPDEAGTPPWDAALVAALSPLRKLQQLEPFAAFAQEGLQALRQYVKPQNAVVGLFLDYENKAAEMGRAA